MSDNFKSVQEIIIADDAQLVVALERYSQVAKVLGCGSGIENMLSMLQDAVINGQKFRELLKTRFYENCDEALESAKSINENLYTAFRYLVNRLRHDELEVDYDPNFLYMIDFVGGWLFDHEADPNVSGSLIAAHYSGYFSNIMKSVVVYRILEKPDEEITKKDIRGTELTITSVLKNYYNIPLYINYHQQAWGEAAEIANAVYDYVFSPKARGNLSNLLPPQGELLVDWRRNKHWMFDLKNEHWLTTGIENTDRIDPRFLSATA